MQVCPYVTQGQWSGMDIGMTTYIMVIGDERTKDNKDKFLQELRECCGCH